MQEKLYNEQLQNFLQQFKIKNYSIPNIGEARKRLLAVAMIENASDISRLTHIKVAGLGTVFVQTLFSWQRDMSSQFLHHPNNDLLEKEHATILSEANKRKT